MLPSRHLSLVYASYTITSELFMSSSCVQIARVSYLTKPFEYSMDVTGVITPTYSSAQSAFSKYLKGSCELPQTVAVPTITPLGMLADPFVPTANSPVTVIGGPAPSSTTAADSHDVVRRLLPAIIVPPIIMVLMLIALIALWRRRRSRKGSRVSSDIDKASHHEHQSDGNSAFLQQKAELASKDARFEIDGRVRRVEVSQENAAELESPETRVASDTLVEWLHAQRVWKVELEGDEAAKEKDGDTVELK